VVLNQSKVGFEMYRLKSTKYKAATSRRMANNGSTTLLLLGINGGEKAASYLMVWLAENEENDKEEEEGEVVREAGLILRNTQYVYGKSSGWSPSNDKRCMTGEGPSGVLAVMLQV